MARKKTAEQALSELRKRRSRMEKMPRIKNPKAKHPGKVGNETATIPSVPRKEIDKDSFLAIIADVWKRFPTLRFGQLITQASKDRVFAIEDEEMLEALKTYDPARPGKCKAKSPSGKFVCSLEENHSVHEHINYELGFAWKV